MLLDLVGHVLLVQTDRRGGRHTTRHRSLLLHSGGCHHVGVGGRDAAIHLLEEVPVLFLGSHHFLLRLAWRLLLTAPEHLLLMSCGSRRGAQLLARHEVLLGH